MLPKQRIVAAVSLLPWQIEVVPCSTTGTSLRHTLLWRLVAQPTLTKPTSKSGRASHRLRSAILHTMICCIVGPVLKPSATYSVWEADVGMLVFLPVTFPIRKAVQYCDSDMPPFVMELRSLVGDWGVSSGRSIFCRVPSDNCSPDCPNTNNDRGQHQHALKCKALLAVSILEA